jgi:apolipoprotein N-acyltransferase
MNKYLRAFLLSILSGYLLWVAWPPHALGWLSFIAFIPLLIIQHDHASGTIRTWYFRLMIYLAILLWNILTTWWIWYATDWGCIATMVLNSLFMSVIWWSFDLVYRKQGKFTGYIFLIAFWLAFELLHLSWELSWPWLTLGNVFANNPLMIQWYEYTGHLGGSVWVLAVNILVFRCLMFATKAQQGKLVKAFLISLLVVIFPLAVSISLYALNGMTKAVKHEVLVIQPNLDPYTEKFSEDGKQLSPQKQLERMLEMAEEKTTERTSFVVFPETALQGSLKEDILNQETLIVMIREYISRHPQVHIITGADTYVIYASKETETARPLRNGEGYYDYFNTALMIDSSQKIEVYHKCKRVPGVELMPYPRVFSFLEQFAIDKGGTSGSLGSQKEPTLFTAGDAKIAPLICYESVYGGFVEGFKKIGANLFFVITNDGWWKNTDGYKQHLAYDRLRCIEFRTQLVQCANTGLSAHINSRGDILEQTSWWKQESMSAAVTLTERKTLYTALGDYPGWAGVIISVLVILNGIVRRFRK